jgi:hypothetical protein
MTVLVLLCSLVLGPGDEVPVVSAETRQAYEAKRAEAGRDAEANVKLAEWCGDHGLTAERAKHLRIAILVDPKNERARELLGLPPAGAKEAAKEAATAEALAEYNDLRERAPQTADGNAALALWCEAHGLGAEAKVHWSEVTRLAPKRADGWTHLGFVKYNGRWMKAELVREIEAQRIANKEWTGRLRLMHMNIHDPPHRDEAEQELNAIRDPRAVPAIYAEFGGGRSDEQAMAVRILGHIHSRASSQALAALAVFGRTPQVRMRAVRALQKRDPVDYVGGMLSLLTDPIRYKVTPVGPDGTPGTLVVEGEKFDVKRVYAPPQLPVTPAQPGEFVAVDPGPGNPDPMPNPWPTDVMGPIAGRLGQAGLPDDHALAALSPLHAPPPMTPTAFANRQAAAGFEARLEGDVRLLETINAGRIAMAHYVLSLAREATGQKELDDDPRTWRNWLTKQAGRSVPEGPKKETLVLLNPPPAYLPRPPQPPPGIS